MSKENEAYKIYYLFYNKILITFITHIAYEKSISHFNGIKTRTFTTFYHFLPNLLKKRKGIEV